MTDSSINLNSAAFQEANRIAAPLLRAKQAAHIAFHQAEVDYLAAWQEAYQYAKEQGF